jgi:hypothetical protein
LAIGDVRPVEEQEEYEEQLQTSTSLEGPNIPSCAEVQTSEVPRNALEVLRNAAGTSRKFSRGLESRNSARHNTVNQTINQQENVQVSTSKPEADDNDEDQPLHQPIGSSHPHVHQVIKRDHPIHKIHGEG